MTPKQWAYVGLLVAFVLGQATYGALAYDYGRKSGARAAQEAAEDALAAYQADAYEARQEAAKANDKLRERLADKPAERVPEVVRANPTDCVVPDPVADSLRDAVRATNRAH